MQPVWFDQRKLKLGNVLNSKYRTFLTYLDLLLFVWLPVLPAREPSLKIFRIAPIFLQYRETLKIILWFIRVFLFYCHFVIQEWYYCQTKGLSWGFVRISIWHLHRFVRQRKEEPNNLVLQYYSTETKYDIVSARLLYWTRVLIQRSFSSLWYFI